MQAILVTLCGKDYFSFPGILLSYAEQPLFLTTMNLTSASLTFILLFLNLIGCSRSSTTPTTASWQSIPGRDHGHSIERPLLYRALVPANWIRHDPPETDSIADTTKANCEFMIREDGSEIKLTVHTFPYAQEEERVPPQAQIARWKRQLEDLDLLSVQIAPDSHGGFSGLYFEGQGKLQGKTASVIGWSMRLAPGYDRQLIMGRLPLDEDKRADYTIKAVGPPDMILKHRSDIIQFAHSFELIDELPSPL